MSQPKRHRDLDLDALDNVQGGADPAGRVYGWSGTVGYGIGSFTVTRTDAGQWYFSPGVGVGSPSFRVGASIDRISVTPKEGYTADDVLREGSVGGVGHVGVGGSVSSNDSGKVVGMGVGLDAGAGWSYGLRGELPSGTNGTSGEQNNGTPVYDAMGNFTGTYEQPQGNAAPGPSSDLHQDNSGTQFAGDTTGGTNLAGDNTFGDNNNGAGDSTYQPTQFASNNDYTSGSNDYTGGNNDYSSGSNDYAPTQVADAGNDASYDTSSSDVA